VEGGRSLVVRAPPHVAHARGALLLVAEAEPVDVPALAGALLRLKVVLGPLVEAGAGRDFAAGVGGVGLAPPRTECLAGT